MTTIIPIMAVAERSFKFEKQSRVVMVRTLSIACIIITSNYVKVVYLLCFFHNLGHSIKYLQPFIFIAMSLLPVKTKINL